MNQQMADYINTAGRAIPGQSLTNDPDNPLPFERSPEFTDMRDAIEFIFVSLLKKRLMYS